MPKIRLMLGDIRCVYKYAYFVYNISMKVKEKTHPLVQLRRRLRTQNGVLLAADLARLGIPRTYLGILEELGEIQRVSRGVYSTPEAIVDEMAGFQSRYKKAVFSHETALYLYDLTDRSPQFFSVTVPAGYNASLLKASGTKVYFVGRELFSMGQTMLKSPHGNDLRAFGLERTICDILRSRNQMDIQFVNKAMQRYMRRQDRNLDLLYRYAGQFNIQGIVRNYIEVLS